MYHNDVEYISKNQLLQKLLQNGYEEVFNILKDKDIDGYTILEPNFESEIKKWKLNSFQRVSLSRFVNDFKDDPKIFNCSRSKFQPNVPTKHFCVNSHFQKTPSKPDILPKPAKLGSRLESPNLQSKKTNFAETKERQKPTVQLKQRSEHLKANCQKLDKLKTYLENNFDPELFVAGQVKTLPDIKKKPFVAPRTNDLRAQKKLVVPTINIGEDDTDNIYENETGNSSGCINDFPSPPRKMSARSSLTTTNNITSNKQISQIKSNIAPIQKLKIGQEDFAETLNEVKNTHRGRPNSDCGYISDKDINVNLFLPDGTKTPKTRLRRVSPPIVPEFIKKPPVKIIEQISVVKENNEKFNKSEEDMFLSLSARKPSPSRSPVVERKPQTLPRSTDEDENEDHEYEDLGIMTSKYLELNVTKPKNVDITSSEKNDNIYENILSHEKHAEILKETKNSKFGIGWMGNLLFNKNTNKLESQNNSQNATLQIHVNKNYNRPLPEIPNENPMVQNDQIEIASKISEEEIEEETDDIYEHMNPPEYANLPKETECLEVMEEDLADKLRRTLSQINLNRVLPAPPPFINEQKLTNCITPESSEDEFEDDPEQIYENVNESAELTKSPPSVSSRNVKSNSYCWAKPTNQKVEIFDDDTEDDETYCQTITKVAIEDNLYYRNCDKEGARILLRDLPDGAFLIRPSSSGSYFCVITIKFGKFRPNRCYDLGIDKLPNNKIKLSTDEDSVTPEFSTLQALIDYFTKESITFEANKRLIEVYLCPILLGNL